MERNGRMLIFLFGGVFGFIYEELFYLVESGILMKRGMTFGPWIAVYGFGAVLIVVLAERFREKPLEVFLVSSLSSGLLEYVTGWSLYRFGALRLWDYNVEKWNWGNIGGFICLRSVLFFGISGLMLIYLVCPLIQRLERSVKRQTFTRIAMIPGTLFCLDILISGILLWKDKIPV